MLAPEESVNNSDALGPHSILASLLEAPAGFPMAQRQSLCQDSSNGSCYLNCYPEGWTRQLQSKGEATSSAQLACNLQLRFVTFCNPFGECETLVRTHCAWSDRPDLLDKTDRIFG